MNMNHAIPRRAKLGFWTLACLAVGGLWQLAEAAPAETVYSVRQSYKIKDLPDGARKVRGWFWMPEDRPEQRVLEFRIVEGPQSLRVTRDPAYGRSGLYAEAEANPAKPLEIVTEFKILRREVAGLAKADLAGSVKAIDRRAFSAELRWDEKHMEVTPAIQGIADGLAGKETNPVIMARRFFDFVIEKSDH
jgi:hypothetical protein